jgi:hypothetical protein
MSPLGIILVVLLILLLFGGLGGGSVVPYWGYGYGFGHGGIALLWQFQLSGVRTCVRQCGHR